MENRYLEIFHKRKQSEIATIKKWNEYTNQYGLNLSDEQINQILEKKKEILRETGRVEFQGGGVDQLIKEFCDSPFIHQENYEAILCELIEIFYEYKNETMDLIADDELIQFMKKAFDGVCQGDLQYLSGTVLRDKKENLLKGKRKNKLEEGEEE